jgi:hypothetical protein
MNTARFYHTASLLPNGMVLVAGGNGADPSAELYNPVTGTWIAASALLTRRDGQVATLLANGRVLLVGGFGNISYTANVESYDPGSGSWVGAAAAMPFPLRYQTATLLPSGQVLVVGGYSTNNVIQPAAQLYDAGSGINASWRPRINSAVSPISVGQGLTLTGSGFRGISGGSGGNFSQDSPADHPVVQLRSMEGERIALLSAASWSSNSFVSAPVGSFPQGWTLVTVFANGIPGTSSVIYLFPQLGSPPINLTGFVSTADPSFRLSFTSTPGAVFTVLAAPNPGLPVSAWSVLGSATEILPGQFQFTDPQASTLSQRFYRLRSP